MPVEILKTARPGTAGVVSRARRCTPLKSGFPGQGDSVIQRPLRAPKHLKPPTRRWWLAVHAVFELEEHHARLLTPAGEAWDRAAAAREAIEKHGITYTDRFGAPRSSPRSRWSATAASPSRGCSASCAWTSNRTIRASRV
jgi:hypothetical protein